MGNNCKPQSLARRRFSGLPGPFGQGKHVDSFSVARVRPRTSKGITDLLLLNLVRLKAACPSKKICCRLESRSLSELTRQIAPPTKNGHAPPPTESRKSYQSVNPSGVRAW
ncbi:hypothetical protein HZH66_015510 [Vespula vulgaris]|uniref:Uncharacterized protein n=2 Tax=Vespula TaxID=7451 RepID=A0A834J7R7_VESPE|nr:hypothetical protein HZH66_015510 [Vespula vulgaris]KAF7383002.1 hypothetical protein H0235_018484 [Vespula pensylvanica]